MGVAPRGEQVAQLPGDRLAAATVLPARGVTRLATFHFESGAVLPFVDVAWESWGRLNSSGDNVIVVCHALTGDAHAGPGNPAGWWSGLIGPGRTLDTDRWYVISSNVIGGCAGSTGPDSLAADGRAYGLRFPLLSVRDIVRAQIRLLALAGVRQVRLVIGGSLGGMQAWEWPLLAPGRVVDAVAVAAHAAFPPLAIGYNEAMRQAIVADPDWQEGAYHGTGRRPRRGLAAARSIGMLTYRSDRLFADRYGREQVTGGTHRDGDRGADTVALSARSAFTDPQYAVESYLHHQGDRLNQRFDANSYLYLTRAMDGHDIGRGRGGLRSALGQLSTRLTVVGIDSDYLYSARELEETVDRAVEAGVDAQYLHLTSPYGHDAFLLEQERLGQLLSERLRLADEQWQKQ